MNKLNYLSYKFGIGQLVVHKADGTIYQVDEVILHPDGIYYGVSEDTYGGMITLHEDDLVLYEGPMKKEPKDDEVDNKLKIVYLCDRKKCTNCMESCKHTSDINHAVNFDHMTFGGEHWEKDPNEKLPDDPKFKVGDKVIYHNTGEVCVIESITVKKAPDGVLYYYHIGSLDGKCEYFSDVSQGDLTFVTDDGTMISVEELVSWYKELMSLRERLDYYITRCTK